MYAFIFGYEKFTMALLATITILLLTVLVAFDGVDSKGSGDSSSK